MRTSYLFTVSYSVDVPKLHRGLGGKTQDYCFSLPNYSGELFLHVFFTIEIKMLITFLAVVLYVYTAFR